MLKILSLVVLVLGVVSCVDSGTDQSDRSDLCNLCNTFECAGVTPSDSNWTVCVLCHLDPPTVATVGPIGTAGALGTVDQLCQAAARQECEKRGFGGDIYCIAALARHCTKQDSDVADKVCGPQ